MQGCEITNRPSSRLKSKIKIQVPRSKTRIQDPKPNPIPRSKTRIQDPKNQIQFLDQRHESKILDFKISGLKKICTLFRN